MPTLGQSHEGATRTLLGRLEHRTMYRRVLASKIGTVLRSPNSKWPEDAPHFPTHESLCANVAYLTIKSKASQPAPSDTETEITWDGRM